MSKNWKKKFNANLMRNKLPAEDISSVDSTLWLVRTSERNYRDWSSCIEKVSKRKVQRVFQSIENSIEIDNAYTVHSSVYARMTSDAGLVIYRQPSTILRNLELCSKCSFLTLAFLSLSRRYLRVE